MSEGLYRGEATKESFARDWKVSRATVDDYAREASRSISLDVSEDPSELLVQVGAMFRAVAALMWPFEPTRVPLSSRSSCTR